MSHPASDQRLQKARASLASRLTFEQFLAKLSAKDRATAERRVKVLDDALDQPRADLWQRLACTLMTLAPHAAKLIGKQTLQIYIADGKYRMQVFALEDLQDGKFTVYAPDVLLEAIDLGLLSRRPTPFPPASADQFLIEPSKEPLEIKQLDKNTPGAPAHFKDMMGWNRKALRIILTATPSVAQVQTTELLCALGAAHFPATANTPTPRPSTGRQT
jgi:hypothetical protein